MKHFIDSLRSKPKKQVNHNGGWNRTEQAVVDRIMELYRAGYSYRAIGALVDKTYSTVGDIVRRER